MLWPSLVVSVYLICFSSCKWLTNTFQISLCHCSLGIGSLALPSSNLPRSDIPIRLHSITPSQWMIPVTFIDPVTPALYATFSYPEQLVTQKFSIFVFLLLQVVNWIYLAVYFSYFIDLMSHLCLLSFVNHLIYWWHT